jgi:hypothetical protein
VMEKKEKSDERTTCICTSMRAHYRIVRSK